MKHQITLTLAILLFTSAVSYSQVTTAYPQAFVSMEDYEVLIEDLKEQRNNNLISFDKLNNMKADENTVILDTRSRGMYTLRHIEGAINLPFTEFSLSNLQALIPDPNTRILIYCNNNFIGDQIHFMSKVGPVRKTKKVRGMTGYGNSETEATKPIMLALNIPTYINLYGYGYENVYELDELVDINDPRLKLESSWMSGAN